MPSKSVAHFLINNNTPGATATLRPRILQKKKTRSLWFDARNEFRPLREMEGTKGKK